MNKKAVILGYGRMGKEHERAYRECNVEVVHTTTREDPDWYSNSIDYVSVCTHDDTHAAYIIDALEAGHKVIAEKPLCLTEDDLKRIYKLATPENLYCNLPLLELDWPECRGAEHIQANYYWGRAEQLPGWRGQIPSFSFVLGAGIHTVSLALSLGGRAIDGVEATGGNYLNESVKFKTIINSWGSFVGGGGFGSVIDCTESKAAHWHELRVRSANRSTTVRNYASDKTAGIKRFIEGKYDRFHNSFAAHSVCFAIERALKSGKRETVEYLS
jgi:predicted dehydrogenase